MRIEDAAWLAGFIDGDGCICLSRNPGSQFRRMIVVVDSTDREILDYIIGLVGGSLVTKKKQLDHHRQCWTWRLVGSNNVRALLEEIAPFMRCEAKRSRAELFLNEWPDCTPRNGFYTHELLSKKEDFERRFLSIGEGRGKRNIGAVAER